MELSIEKQGNINVVEVKGRLDTSNYMEFDNKLQELMTPGSFTLVDCTELDYVSSSGLRVLLIALKKSEQTGSKLALCSLKPQIMEIFKISAFDSIFTIFPDRKSALKD